MQRNTRLVITLRIYWLKSKYPIPDKVICILYEKE